MEGCLIMIDELKEKVLQANLALPAHGLVTFTWGNVSGISHKDRLIVIKPSGVPYNDLQKEHMVVVNFDGEIVDGDLHPSSDTPTHLALYKNFPDVGGIVHTHAPWSTSWAQAGRSIDRKSTRLNSSHVASSYAVFCLKKKNEP